MNHQPGNISKLRNIALAMILTAGVGAPSIAAINSNQGSVNQAQAEEQNGNDASQDNLKSALDSVNASASTDTISTQQSKEESVFLLTKANGDVKQTIVSDWLHNVNKDQKLEDQSDLDNITNTESEAGFTQNGDKLTWDAQGDDIYYQGTTNKEAPISMKVTYKLDGQEVSADDIAGKSGKVEIRYDFTNNTGKTMNVDGTDQQVYTPFTCITGLVLDNDNFKNVEVTNGRSVNDGDHTTVAGLAMPGMQDNLGISKDVVDIPDHFTVTADVTDFKLANTGTIVTNDALNNIDTDNLSSESIEDQINQVQDAMRQLIDGSGQLADGLDQLADGAGQLDTGLSQLQSSTASLPDSANQLANGSNQLAAGILSAYDGSSQLSAGIGSAYDGTQQLSDANTQIYNGLRALKYGTSTQTGLSDAVDAVNQLQGGASSLSAGLREMQTETNAGLTQLHDGATQLNTGLTDGKTALDGALTDDGELMTGLGTMEKGAQQSSKTIDSLPDSVKTKLEPAISAAKKSSENSEQAQADASTAYQTTAELEGNLNAILSGVPEGAITPEIQNQIDTIRNQIKDLKTQTKGAAEKAGTANAYSTGLSATLSGVDITSNTQYQAAKQQAADLQTGLAATQGGLKDIRSGADTSLERAIVASGLMANSINDSIPQLNAGYVQLISGCDQIDNGLLALNNGGNTLPNGKENKGLQGAMDGIGDDSTSGTLLYGANAMGNGLGQVNGGMSQLSGGADALTNGLGSAVDGSNQLAGGLGQLQAQTPALVNGIGQLKDGSSQLASGAQSADDGSKQLQDGLTQFNDQVVQRIVDAYNDNVKGLSSHIEATVNAGKDYDNFSGKDSQMAGSVKFIIETDSINMD